MAKLTNKEALERVQSVHKDKYLYDKFAYNGYSQKVCLICPIHGEFWVKYCDIIQRGQGCSKCKHRSYTLEEFVEKSKQVHGDKYDYSKVEYKNANTKVCIICPKHGEFWQKPSSHLRGDGCPQCYNDRRKGRFLGTSSCLTAEQFIEKARKVHRDKYDYSNANYIDYETPVSILCPLHGEFWQRPSVHLRGGNCPRCSNCKHSTTEEFIEKAKLIHGDKYDYSKVDYKNNKTKVCIICPEHGEFWQSPVKHVNVKQGCPNCARNVRLTHEEFVEKAKQSHSDKNGESLYDYSLCKYENANSLLHIICPKHGEFIQSARDHYWGHRGCPKCGTEAMIEKQRLTTDEFIKRAKDIHGDKYDYSKVEYISTNNKITIICPQHGEFCQTPNAHLQGQGCPKCGKESMAEKQKLTLEEFVARAKDIHGDEYDYSKVKYVNMNTKVCITCPKHGEFWIAPQKLLYAHQGCQKCVQSLIEKSVDILLKNINISSTPYYRDSWLGMLSLDFYIPQYNIAIECQGLQHFEPTDFGGKGIDNAKLLFESQIDRDLKKIELCNEHGITLLHYATCEVPKDFDLYEVITSEEELIGKIREIISIKQSECIEI